MNEEKKPEPGTDLGVGVDQETDNAVSALRTLAVGLDKVGRSYGAAQVRRLANEAQQWGNSAI